MPNESDQYKHQQVSQSIC